MVVGHVTLKILEDFGDGDHDDDYDEVLQPVVEQNPLFGDPRQSELLLWWNHKVA